MIDAYHHDGSALYVSTQDPAPGETVSVFVRGPVAAGVQRVHVRSTPDGEPRFTEAVRDRVVDGVVWWRAEVTVRNLVTHYRFLLSGPAGYHWLTAYGVVAHDVPDGSDFRLVAHPAPPAWSRDAIVYQIFPDRFARSAASGSRTAPDWAIPCDWDTPVIGRGPETPRQWYGGDLDGIAEHLDHIQALGANTVYMTPVFPAQSNHRYDAATFDHVDPVLGGDEALQRLAAAVHARGMRIVGDITTNHTGDAHPWFTGEDRDDLYYVDTDGGYESWCGVPSLPKLNWGSAELRRRFFDGPDSIVERWLRDLDGWRVDVANMTGRLGTTDLTLDVASRMADAVRDARPEAMLVAEHAHDASDDLDRGGWQGTMNYAGFTRPTWSWLSGHGEEFPDFLGVPGGVPRRGGEAVVATMRVFASRVSWRSLTHSWTLLGSHDTPRIRTVLGNPDLVEVALGMLATMPGIPMIFAGDELGLEGVNGEDSRRPMPWHRADSWHRPTYDRYRDLLRLRADRAALRHGGLRWAHIGEDALAYWRETPTERLLVQVRRAGGAPVVIGGKVNGTNVYGGGELKVSGDETRLPEDGPSVQIWACD